MAKLRWIAWKHNKQRVYIMEDTKVIETPSVEPVKTVGLYEEPRKNKEGEWIGSTWTGSLAALKPDQLDQLFDTDNIHAVMQEVIRFTYDGTSVDEKLIESNNAGWILNPKGSQVEALNIGSFDPKGLKRAVKAIDLEHRKITKDKDGNVSVWREAKDSDGKPIIVWNSKTGETENKMEWSKDGKTLFSAKDMTNCYNFVIHANGMLNLEPQYDVEQRKFVAEGGRTVTLKKNKKSMTRTLQKPTKGKKKTTIKGYEFTAEELENLVANAQSRGELGEQQDNQ